MNLRYRLAKLEQSFGAGEKRWCNCPVEIIEVREGDPKPVNSPPSRDAAGRPVCGTCGLPHRTGQIAFIEIRLARRNDAEPAP